ncbi:histidine kinase, partial [Nostoc sp. NIES-2111]
LLLNWSYASQDHSLAKTYCHLEEIIFPPATELVNLYQAAKTGYVMGIQEEINRIRQLDEKYTGFSNKLSELVAEFEDEEIVAMIQPYLSA